MPDQWRIGRKVGRTIYVQHGRQPSDQDDLIGMMDTAALANQVVIDHNAMAGFTTDDPDERVEQVARLLHDEIERRNDEGYDPQPDDWMDLQIEEERETYRLLARRVLSALGGEGPHEEGAVDG